MVRMLVEERYTKLATLAFEAMLRKEQRTVRSRDNISYDGEVVDIDEEGFMLDGNGERPYFYYNEVASFSRIVSQRTEVWRADNV